VPQFPNASAPLADLPLAVPGVSEQPGSGELLAALHRELAQLSEDAGLEIVQGARHESLTLNRECTRAVARAIKWSCRRPQIIPSTPDA
jgi:hypothetical protein